MHERIDLAATVGQTTGSGVHWTLPEAFKDLNANLVVLEQDSAIGAHVNDELDVLVIGVFGIGEAIIDGQVLSITPGCLLAIGRGSTREFRARHEALGYLTVHRRRHGLALGSAH